MPPPKRRAAPSPSPSGRSPSPAARVAGGGGSAAAQHDAEGPPFTLRLELADARHTVCFFASTGAADLGSAIAAAFGRPAEVVALWDVEAEEGPIVVPLAAVVAHPQRCDGRRFSLAAPPPLHDQELWVEPPPQLEAPQTASLLDVLAPRAPHPRDNPEMLVALTLGAGALLSADPTAAGEAVPAGLWRLTQASRVVIVLLLVVVVSGQLRTVLKEERNRAAMGPPPHTHPTTHHHSLSRDPSERLSATTARLTDTLGDRALQQQVGGTVAALTLLWFTRVFDTAARLAIVGAVSHQQSPPQLHIQEDL